VRAVERPSASDLGLVHAEELQQHSSPEWQNAVVATVIGDVDTLLGCLQAHACDRKLVIDRPWRIHVTLRTGCYGLHDAIPRERRIFMRAFGRWQELGGRGEETRSRRLTVGEANFLAEERGVELAAGKLLVEIALEVRSLRVVCVGRLKGGRHGYSGEVWCAKANRDVGPCTTVLPGPTYPVHVRPFRVVASSHVSP
jgi:hypothetical protein